MDFQLSDDQRALGAGIRELLAGRFDRDRMRAAHDGGGGVDRALWRELGAAGLFALRLPETAGGVGLGLPESVLLFEEMGRALLPGPLAATQLAAGAVKGAAEGEAVVALAEAGRPVGHLEGTDALLVLDGEAGGAVGRVLSGRALRQVVREAEPMRSLDPGTPLWRVPDLAGYEGEPLPDGARPRHEGALLAAAEQLGSAGRSLEAAVQHAREREQFAAPIGSFQAVKHLCAGMLVRAETARTAVYAAAVTGDPMEIAGAKLLADEAAVGNARDCLQVHGGMGFTWEADVHLHLKRAWLRAGQWLTAADAEEALAADLG
ncbi:alkylation response protein AidB-like acyl-CoA dehydrogenase [Streptomyces sp. 840.1]|uniref:acyl-CoA dehydrogenase family protein n=1 Tax=Streptomyces sp. 840.1 TaxID=2485152 RepID=UPI000F4913D3|nr:acyl-CoA dehydrogenase family protein [Streptomyces sp. 840.1]ROQ66964.1 alkylation response protein AidB-like acyl-CoA dehydrogenase [Streptomyces sp. 840.1]